MRQVCRDCSFTTSVERPPETCVKGMSRRRSLWRWKVGRPLPCFTAMRSWTTQGVADAMDMLERSQDEQRQRFEDMLRTAVERSGTTVDSAPSDTERSTSSAPITSRLHHVRGVETPTLRLHRGTKKAAKREHHKTLGVVPGGGVEPPRYQVPADFESAASASSAIPAIGRS